MNAPMNLTRSLRAPLAALLLAASCAPAQAPERPTVLVSVPPQAWLVERLAGDLVDVEIMVPPGADPHTYEPTMKQLRAASRASIYLKVGHPHFSFERVWLDRFLAEQPSMRIVEGAEGVAGRAEDPHVWTSPSVMRAMAGPMARALAAADPEHASEYTRRLGLVQAEIDTLDQAIRRMLAPCARRTFLVFHPAWGYFADAYGLTQTAIEHDGKSPAPAELARVIEACRASGVRVVFVQPQTGDAAARTVAEAIGGRVVTLDPLAHDWAAGMRAAAEAFREALCD